MDPLAISISISKILFPAIIGGIVAVIGTKYHLKLSAKTKYKERFIAKKIEAYEELYRYVINSTRGNITQTKDESRSWVSKYGLYLSDDIASAYLVFNSTFDLYMNNKNEKTKSKYTNSVAKISAIIAKELFIDKIIDSENFGKLLNLK